MCIQREPYNYSSPLYQKHSEALTQHFKTNFVPALQKAKEQHAHEFLKEWVKRWRCNKWAVDGMTRMFMYLVSVLCSPLSLQPLPFGDLQYRTDSMSPTRKIFWIPLNKVSLCRTLGGHFETDDTTYSWSTPPSPFFSFRTGYTLFRQNVFESFKDTAREGILDCILRERDGEEQDRDLLRDAIAVTHQFSAFFALFYRP